MGRGGGLGFGLGFGDATGDADKLEGGGGGFLSPPSWGGGGRGRGRGAGIGRRGGAVLRGGVSGAIAATEVIGARAGVGAMEDSIPLCTSAESTSRNPCRCASAAFRCRAISSLCLAFWARIAASAF